MDKYVNILFKPINESGLLRTYFWWIIDSKLKKKQLLHEYLDVQYKRHKLLLEEIVKKEKFYIHKKDIAIIKILRYVKQNYNYITDFDNFKQIELWEDIDEVIANKKGDCESQNTLIYLLALATGISQDQMFAFTCNSTVGGHFAIFYFTPEYSKIENKFQDGLFVIDSTFNVDLNYIEYRKPFKLGNGYKKIWHIFNQYFTWKFKQ